MMNKWGFRDGCGFALVNFQVNVKIGQCERPPLTSLKKKKPSYLTFDKIGRAHV